MTISIYKYTLLESGQFLMNLGGYMKSTLFLIFFLVHSQLVNGCTDEFDQSTCKIYIDQDENGEFLLDTPQGEVIVDEVRQDENGYLIYLDHLTPKSLSKFYCHQCKKKFFKTLKYHKHKCKSIYD